MTVVFAVLYQARAESVSAAEFPFECRDGFLWVKVHVPQSAAPLNFLLDTGASVSVINLEALRRLRLRRGAPVMVQGVESMTRGFWPERLSATADAVPLPRNYLAVDLGKLGQACACRVDGLIGMDFFRGKVVQLDFAGHKIRLLNSHGKEPVGRTAIALNLRPCGMEVPVQVNGSEPRLVRLDTGCASALQWVTKAVPLKDCSQRPAVALSAFTVNETPSQVRVGVVEFSSVATGLHPEAIFAGEAGLLGNGILCRFDRVTIDASRGRLILGDVHATN